MRKVVVATIISERQRRKNKATVFCCGVGTGSSVAAT